jgi:hypothetical protein
MARPSLNALPASSLAPGVAEARRVARVPPGAVPRAAEERPGAAVQRGVVRHVAVQPVVVQHGAAPRGAVQHGVAPRVAVRHVVAPRGAVQHGVVQRVVAPHVAGLGEPRCPGDARPVQA